MVIRSYKDFTILKVVEYLTIADVPDTTMIRNAKVLDTHLDVNCSLDDGSNVNIRFIPDIICLGKTDFGGKGVSEDIFIDWLFNLPIEDMSFQVLVQLCKSQCRGYTVKVENVRW